MRELIVKRFETPDEVRKFEKGKFETSACRNNDDWSSHLRTGLEMVDPPRSVRWKEQLRDRARGHGSFGQGHRCNE